METNKIEQGREWAIRQFGKCQLGDWRRTSRAVSIAEAMIRKPWGTIPQQMQVPKATKAAYRFFSNGSFQYKDLMSPHWEETRAAARLAKVVLMVQDLTELDYSKYGQTIEGLAPIGNNRGLGILMNSVLSIIPEPRQVIGIAYQEPFFRKYHVRNETRSERAKREKESDVWVHAVHAIGQCVEGIQWVHVGDSSSDMYAFFIACVEEQCHFLVRARNDRRMRDTQGEYNHLMSYARQLAASDETVIHLPGRHKEPAHNVQVKIAFAPLTLLAGWMNAKADPIATWVVRVWEEYSSEGIEPIEWVLLTSVPTQTLEQAWERVGWYRCRWLVEEFHQCLKTGCQIESRHLGEVDSLLRLLGIVAPVAVQLLSLKEQSRLQPDAPAARVVPSDLLQVVALLSGRSSQELTMSIFWRLVAQFGGYQGRKSDGPPGWKSLWSGWRHILSVLSGYRLASLSPPS